MTADWGRRTDDQRLDSSTNLLYYGARYYDPALGRFISADTVVPEPGHPQALNRYAYVLNNPFKYTDPSGHYTYEETPDDPVFVWLYPNGGGVRSTWKSVWQKAAPMDARGTSAANASPLAPSGVALAGNAALSASDMLSGIRMWRGGFRVERSGTYSSGRGKVSIYGARASRPGQIGPTWTHAGIDNPAVAPYATAGGAVKAAFKSGAFWGSLALAAGVDVVDYSPWGSRSEAGYETEFAAALTVDVAIIMLSTGSGAVLMVIAPGGGYVVGPIIMVGGPVLADISGGRQWAVDHVTNFYEAILTTPISDYRWIHRDFIHKSLY